MPDGGDQTASRRIWKCWRRRRTAVSSVWWSWPAPSPSSWAQRTNADSHSQAVGRLLPPPLRARASRRLPAGANAACGRPDALCRRWLVLVIQVHGLDITFLLIAYIHRSVAGDKMPWLWLWIRLFCLTMCKYCPWETDIRNANGHEIQCTLQSLLMLSFQLTSYHYLVRHADLSGW